MNDFERALEDWIGCTRAYHTRVNFKLYFETAHEVLRRLRGSTLKNTIFTNTANSITNSVQRIDATESSILNALTSTSGSSNDESSMGELVSEGSSVSGLTERVNATTSDTV